MIKSIVNPIRDYVISLVHLGTDLDQSSLDSFYIKLLNVAALAMIVVLVTAFPIVGNVRDFLFYTPIIGMLFCAVGALYFNNIRQYDLAKVTLLLALPIVQLINLLYVDTQSIAVESTFLPMALIAAVVFQNNSIRIILVLILMSFFSIVFVSRNYNVEGYHFYTPLVLFIGVLLGVVLVVEYLKDTAQVLKDRNDQLTAQNQNLEDLVIQNDLKTELLGILSHDLKGPATAFNQLSKKISFLLQKERYDELVEFGNYFEMAGDKIYHDIDRLLNWTIAQKKDIITRVEEISPQRLIGRIVEGLQYQVKDKEVKFNNAIAKNISLHTDKHILEIILKNLLINAANHSLDKAYVEIMNSEEIGFHVISISNKGTAIDMDIVIQAKEGRYRKSKEGHGLGLGICFSLIKFLEGEIEFESSGVRGTTVFVKLPKEV